MQEGDLMKKFIRNIFIIFGISLLFTSLIFSKITAEQKKSVQYNGDFCSFEILCNYQMEFKNQGQIYSYVIYDLEDSHKKLIITNDENQMVFEIKEKNKTSKPKIFPVKLHELKGEESQGVDSSNKHWREIYLEAPSKDLNGNKSLIHIYYDSIDENTARDFDGIIDTLTVKDSRKK
jgi:hypothetical protein